MKINYVQPSVFARLIASYVTVPAVKKMLATELRLKLQKPTSKATEAWVRAIIDELDPPEPSAPALPARGRRITPEKVES